MPDRKIIRRTIASQASDYATTTTDFLLSGVATTADVGVGYSEWGGLDSVAIANQYTETYEFDSYARVSSVTKWILGQQYGTKTYTTGYEYNLGNQLTKLIYPSGQQVVVNHDDKGRLQSLTDDFENPYLSGMTYNLAGQVTGLTLGNGVVESYGYDANRLQLTTQTATRSGNQLMNLTYNYQATAGQMGQGSTAGNARQLMGITGTMNSTTESAGYTYDLLGRLVTSSQTSNGASANRQFVYDRWGNRTEVYDGLPGGKNPPTLIQSVTLQQSGGAPTNRITSVTSGSTVNYTYDAAGNVTNDGAHTYKYDAESRIVKVDDGATAEYRYDHQNRRVTKIVGSSWTHYIWEGGQLIGEHDATTPLPGYGQPPYQEQSARLDYVYSGARMISSRQRATSTGPWTTAYFLSDRLSVRMTLNWIGNVSGRQAHLPFGEDFGESGTQEKHHFTSYERDSESGTDYAVNRQLAQSIGRFNRVDPLAPSARLDAPQSWNRYSYVHNEPVDQTDPLGLDSEQAPVPGHDHNDHGPCPAWMQYCPNGGSGFGLLLSDLPAAIGGGNGDGGGGFGFEFGPGRPPSRQIRKNYSFALDCGSKNAAQAMAELQSVFTDFASFEGDFGHSINFERVPITLNAQISIHLVYAGLLERDVHVTVNRFYPFGWTFRTESNHPIYPGTIAFVMEDIVRNRGNRKFILFNIIVRGTLNGVDAAFAFDNGIDEFEDDVWENLYHAVQGGICGI